MAIHTKIWIGFALSLLALSLVATSGYRATQNAIVQSSWVDRSHEVVSLIETAITHFNNAETGQRGYLLTGNPNYLEPYEYGTASIPAILSKTRTLTIDNPSQQQRIEEIEVLYFAKLIELQETIDIYKAGDPARAFDIVLTDHGKQVMDNIRAVIQDMRTEEERLMAVRKQDSKAAAQKVLFIGIFGGMLILAGALIAITAFSRSHTRRYLVEHNQLEAELNEKIAQLEQSLHLATTRKHKGFGGKLKSVPF